MANIQDVTTQQLICGGLVLAVIIALILGYDTEFILVIIGGLIGFLTNSKVDQDKIQSTIEDGINDTLEEMVADDTIIVEEDEGATVDRQGA